MRSVWMNSVRIIDYSDFSKYLFDGSVGRKDTMETWGQDWIHFSSPWPFSVPLWLFCIIDVFFLCWYFSSLVIFLFCCCCLIFVFVSLWEHFNFIYGHFVFLWMFCNTGVSLRTLYIKHVLHLFEVVLNCSVSICGQCCSFLWWFSVLLSSFSFAWTYLGGKDQAHRSQVCLFGC